MPFGVRGGSLGMLFQQNPHFKGAFFRGYLFLMGGQAFDIQLDGFQGHPFCFVDCVSETYTAEKHGTVTV